MEESIKCLVNNMKHNSELEIRFGSFSNFKFYPYTTFNKFNQLKNSFDFETIEKIWVYYPQNIRNCGDIWEQKTKIQTIDHPELNIRVALSSEIQIPKNTGKPILFRKKIIHTYVKNGIKFDLSEVKESKNLEELNNAKTRYSIEIELTDKTQISFLIENVKMVIETQRVYDKYINLVDSKYFIGVQPVTMTFKNISFITKEEYSVTDKADGERRMMFITDGLVYLISNKMQIVKTDFTSCFNDTLIDGELINENLFSAFDIIFFKGKDLRGDNINLKERLELIDKTFKTISSDTRPSLFIQIKKFLFGNVFDNSKTILDYFKKNKTVYNIDGLIFTPVNQPISTHKTWRSLLKWKPSHLNTIDFLIKKKDNPKIWELYTKSKEGHILFEKVPEIYVPNEHEWKDNCVIECCFSEGTFKPLKYRDDKINGNFSEVALDIYNSILNPVKEEHITKSRIKEDFKEMRKFHNIIKNDLVKRFTFDKTSLLDLACGKAGDLHKWINSDIQEIVGIDINPEFLKEANRRLNENKSHKKITFYELDLSKNSISKDLGIDKKFDVINCQFAIHYFFENKNTVVNFFENVKNHLNDNGVFIGTVFDGLKVFNCLSEGDIVHKQNNKTLLKITKGYKSEEFKELQDYGESINVFLGGNTILTDSEEKGTEEFIVDFNKFVELADTFSLELVETNLFQNIYKEWIINKNGTEIPEYQKDFSFLNRTFVFKKKEEKKKYVTSDELMNCLFSQEEIIKMKDKKDYSGLLLKDLKIICKERNIKNTGKKQELIDRLINL